jgi:hypothetical protein
MGGGGVRKEAVYSKNHMKQINKRCGQSTKIVKSAWPISLQLPYERLKQIWK